MKVDLTKEKMNALEMQHRFDVLEKRVQSPVHSNTKIRGYYDNNK